MENDSIIKAKDFTTYSTLSLWDTFRAQQPLLTIIEPNRVAEIVKSMLAFTNIKNITSMDFVW